VRLATVLLIGLGLAASVPFALAQPSASGGRGFRDRKQRGKHASVRPNGSGGQAYKKAKGA
jgi:hypothetical protein